VLDAAQDVARHAGAVVQLLRTGAMARAKAAASGGLMVDDEDRPVEAIVRQAAASKRADLVVVARDSHPYAVICEAPCPVLSV